MSPIFIQSSHNWLEAIKVDVLSEVFATLRLQSRLYFDTDLRGNFSIQVPSEKRRIRFHLVRQGHCWLQVRGKEAVELKENDLAIIPNGVEQIISKHPDLRPVLLSRLLQNGACKDGVLAYGTGDSVSRLLCGFCQFDEEIEHPVISSLPDLIVIRMADLGAQPWTSTAVRLLCLESDLKGQAMNGILTRMLEVIFMQTVRRMSQAPGNINNGFIAALCDRQLSRALYAMHDRPQAVWAISDLARLSGMSRGRFAEKFARMVGVPPIEYLTNWRLMKARTLLTNSSLDMAEIAHRCGYKSVPSFTRRFKQKFAVGPGHFRRSARSLQN